MLNERLLAIIGTSIGVIGVLLSIFFYMAVQEERQPIFLVDNASRATILSKSQVSESTIIVTRKDGKEIEQDVNIAKFYFWNEGRLPIKRENVLKAIQITLEEGAEIFSYKIISSTRDVVSEDVIQKDSRTLALTFNIMEQNDGISGQIIYSGSKYANIEMSGVIEGVGEIKYCSCLAPKPLGLLYALITALGISVVAIITITLKKKSLSNKRKVIVVTIIIALVIIYGYFLYIKTAPSILMMGDPPKILLENPK